MLLGFVIQYAPIYFYDYDPIESECEMKLELTNGIFCYLIVGISVFNGLIGLLRYLHQRTRQAQHSERQKKLKQIYFQYMIINLGWVIIADGILLPYALATMSKFSSACVADWDLLYFLQYLMTVLLCFVPGIMFILIALFSCCFPRLLCSVLTMLA